MCYKSAFTGRQLSVFRLYNRPKLDQLSRYTSQSDAVHFILRRENSATFEVASREFVSDSKLLSSFYCVVFTHWLKEEDERSRSFLLLVSVSQRFTSADRLCSCKLRVVAVLRVYIDDSPYWLTVRRWW